MRSGTGAVFYRGNDSVGELASKSTDPFVFFFFVSGFSPSARASHGDKKKEKKNTLDICPISDD